jgi:acyl phosphate:glycerol-3-phosphate acyltransferase
VPGPAAGMLLVATSFLAGAIPWGYLAGRLTRGVDLRTIGSGGTGATNVLRALGARASAVVVVLDFLKGLLPVLLAKMNGFPPAWIAAAAVAAVAGHCWSPFIGFKGGKGMATGAGAVIALFPPALAALPVMAIIVWKTRFVSLGSLVSAGVAILLAILFTLTGHLDQSAAIAVFAIALIIYVRHHENIRRLRLGTERRIGESVRI